MNENKTTCTGLVEGSGVQICLVNQCTCICNLFLLLIVIKADIWKLLMAIAEKQEDRPDKRGYYIRVSDQV